MGVRSLRGERPCKSRPELHLSIWSSSAAAAGDDHSAFAYSTSGRYDGTAPHVERLPDSVLLEFIQEQPHLLPPRVAGLVRAGQLPRLTAARRGAIHRPFNDDRGATRFLRDRGEDRSL